VAWGAKSMLKIWTDHEQRKLEILHMTGALPNTSSFSELKAEIERVRATSNEYDLSIQHTLDEIQQRLAAIESDRTSYRALGETIIPSTVESERTVKAGQAS
jgi:hypothetical protein